jgi:hypothetical protein
MNKEQRKYLLPNLLCSVPSFMIPFFILTLMVKTDLLITIALSLYIYFIDVSNNILHIEEIIRKSKEIIHNKKIFL